MKGPDSFYTKQKEKELYSKNLKHLYKHLNYVAYHLPGGTPLIAYCHRRPDATPWDPSQGNPISNLKLDIKESLCAITAVKMPSSENFPSKKCE